MNHLEIMEIQSQVWELIAKCLMRESLSPCVMPTLLVPMKDGSIRMCMDSYAIKKLAIKYQHLIPGLHDMLDEPCGSRVFSKVDFVKGY